MNIIADGEYPIRVGSAGISTSRVVVYVSGELGGATAALGHKNSAGGVTPLQNGALTPGEQYTIDMGVGVELVVTVSGASGTTDITVDTAELQ